MAENNFSEITETIKTKYSLDDFMFQLDSLMESLFDVHTTLEQKLDTILSYDKKEKILTVCRQRGVSVTDPVKFQHFLMELRAELKKIPVITLTIGFEPKGPQVRGIVAWFQQNLNRQFILDVTVDRSLMAGAIVVYNGTYRDFSLRRKFKEAQSAGKLNLQLEGENPVVQNSIDAEPQTLQIVKEASSDSTDVLNHATELPPPLQNSAQQEINTQLPEGARMSSPEVPQGTRDMTAIPSISISKLSTQSNETNGTNGSLNGMNGTLKSSGQMIN